MSVNEVTRQMEGVMSDISDSLMVLAASKKMRAAQKEYFSLPTTNASNKAKDAENQYDRLLEDLMKRMEAKYG